MNIFDKYEFNKNEIEDVIVQMDDDVPEYMEGVERIATIEIKLSDGRRLDIDDYANTEFFEDDQVEEFIYKKFGVKPSDVIY